MQIKTFYLDTHVYDYLNDRNGITNQEYQKIIYTIQKNIIVIVFSGVIRNELAASFANKPDRTRDLLKTVLEINPQKILLPTQNLISNDIKSYLNPSIKNPMYLTGQEHNDFYNDIKNSINGGIKTSLIEDWSVRRKKDIEDFNKPFYKKWTQKRKEHNMEPFKDFDDFSNESSKSGQSDLQLIEKLVYKYGITSEEKEAKELSKNIYDNIEKIPYLQAYMLAISSVGYALIFQNLKQRTSHRGDIDHLINVTKADYFVTEDSDFKKTFCNVHKNKPMFCLKDFVALLKQL